MQHCGYLSLLAFILITHWLFTGTLRSGNYPLPFHKWGNWGSYDWVSGRTNNSTPWFLLFGAWAVFTEPCCFPAHDSLESTELTFVELKHRINLVKEHFPGNNLKWSLLSFCNSCYFILSIYFVPGTVISNLYTLYHLFKINQRVIIKVYYIWWNLERVNPSSQGWGWNQDSKSHLFV